MIDAKKPSIIEGMDEFFTKILYKNGDYTYWYRLPMCLNDIMNKYQGISYNMVHSEKEPTKDPWNLVEDEKFIRVGTSCGKGYGGASTDTPMTNTYRTNRRGGTTQPKDRMRDHAQLIIDGPETVLSRKNYATQGKAFQPFWDEYGWGKDVANNVWVSLFVPHTDKMFNEQTILLEMMELGTIAKHLDYHGDSPITDLKYRSKSAEEVYGKANSKSARLTKIQADSSYDTKVTDNYSADPYPHFSKCFG